MLRNEPPLAKFPPKFHCSQENLTKVKKNLIYLRLRGPVWRRASVGAIPRELVGAVASGLVGLVGRVVLLVVGRSRRRSRLRVQGRRWLRGGWRGRRRRTGVLLHRLGRALVLAAIGVAGFVFVNLLSRVN